MKRAVAIVLSLILIGIRAMASAQTPSASLSHAVKPECGCCVQKDVCRCCCVAPAEPDAKPLPAVPVTTSATFDFSALVAKHVAWLLPASAPAIVSSSDSSPSSLTVPLFTQHCALLI